MIKQIVISPRVTLFMLKEPVGAKVLKVRFHNPILIQMKVINMMLFLDGFIYKHENKLLAVHFPL